MRVMHYDCLVIGLGGMGSSALYHLAKKGLSVCGVEQFDPVHDRGSSHGHDRIFRKAYFEHPDYVPLLHSAEKLWRELESETGAQLYRRTGVVLSGPPGGEAVNGTLAAARQHALPVEVLNPREADQRWPLLQFPSEHAVVLDNDAGILAVEDCVRQFLDRAQQLGAAAFFNEQVTGWKAMKDSVTVTTDQAIRSAGAVVFTSGAWSPSLFSGPWPSLQVLHKLQLWHTVDPVYVPRLAEMPAFYFEMPQGAFYGMPSRTTEVKIARHTGGAPVDDPSEPGHAAMQEEYQPCVRFAGEWMHGVSATPLRTKACLYTVSADGHFLLDRHPECRHIVFGAGFSGHGFKFASVIGAALADLAISGETEHPIEFLSAGRFA